MKLAGRWIFTGLLFATALLLGSHDTHSAPPSSADPPGRDAVMDWNSVALEVVAEDHSGTFGPPSQGGPVRTARALAIVHAAVFDAVNSIEPQHTPYLLSHPGQGASIDAAAATAAHDTLIALYPDQAAELDAELSAYLAVIPDGQSKARGIALGRLVAKKMLKEREDDGSTAPMPYTPGTDPGDHQLDPLNPGQGYLDPGWGSVLPFALASGDQFQALPPPALGCAEYTSAFEEVKSLGGDGIITPTSRTAEQTEIGLFWAYDGARGLGVPPRLYNQIAQVIAIQEGNTEVENARLFALLNIAMADAGIAAWETKYHYDLWRPIVAIRQAHTDGNPATAADTTWRPLGAPASNQSGNDFTPPFPAYTSGHSTFGGALFRTLENFYGTDSIAFDFVSDELNGITTDSQGVVRPLVVRHFSSLSQAAEENAISRIYLGIHWRFDATEGIVQGTAVADHVFANILQPLP